MKTVFFALIATAGIALGASDFFEIKDVKFLPTPEADNSGIWINGDLKLKEKDVFVPSLKVQISTAENISSKDLIAKAYFFSESGKLLKSEPNPLQARRDNKVRIAFVFSPLLLKGKTESIYFPFPRELIGKKWSVVIVFGDAHDLAGQAFPSGALFGFEFPEKSIVMAPSSRIVRSEVQDPVIEHVVHTKNPRHPKITLFLRFPNKMTDASNVRGVLAMCVLAHRVEDIKRKLQSPTPAEYGGLLKFADTHNMAVLCWGSQILWKAGASYDELERNTNIELDRAFDEVAAAWDRGVDELHEKYALPEKDYLLWGVCASAQWAHRLALRKPERFLAAYIHIPSSFDRPTPEGAKLLWLLTSGELDGGYERGIRWYQDCRAAGYPIIYKAVMNLGHSGSPIADNLGMKFFDYALSLQKDRNDLDERQAKTPYAPVPKESLPWPPAFRNPEFIGDYMNQEIFPASQQKLVPETFRVPLPNKVLADAWNQ